MPPKAVPFEDRVIPVTESGCHLFDGAWTGSMYGAIKVAGKMVSAHRFAWETENGPIPDGLQVLHKCDTPQCVNPAHLFLGTGLVNMRDKIVKGRANTPVGTAQGGTKLDDESVLRIRADPRSHRVIADEYRVHPSVVSKIKSRKSWGWMA